MPLLIVGENSIPTFYMVKDSELPHEVLLPSCHRFIANHLIRPNTGIIAEACIYAGLVCPDVW